MYEVNVTKTVYNFLDSLADKTKISGWELFDKINSKTGKHTYPSTLLGYCRDYCDITGGDWECIDRHNSVYLYHKGIFKLNNLTIYGKE